MTDPQDISPSPLQLATTAELIDELFTRFDDAVVVGRAPRGSADDPWSSYSLRYCGAHSSCIGLARKAASVIDREWECFDIVEEDTDD